MPFASRLTAPTLTVALLGVLLGGFSLSPLAQDASPATETTAAAAEFNGYPVTQYMDVTLLEGADIARGHDVYDRVGICLNCHGWNGDGAGKNPRSEGNAALLRETQLDTRTLIDIISCGIPGTPMPYHNSQAYKKPETCYGLTMADFTSGETPQKGNTIRPADIINLTAYIQTHIQGAGETTLAQCKEYYGANAEALCREFEE